MQTLIWIVCLMLLINISGVAQGQVIEDEMDTEQIIVENWKIVNSYKVDISSDQLNKLLIGVWRFVGPEYSELQPITALPLDTTLTDKTVLFNRLGEFKYDMQFSDGYEYRFLQDSLTARDSGSWSYDEGNRTLWLEYHEPYFADEMLKTLNLPGQDGEELMIYSLTEEYLLVLRPTPVNAFENWFYLIRYQKGH